MLKLYSVGNSTLKPMNTSTKILPASTKKPVTTITARRVLGWGGGKGGLLRSKAE